MKDENEQIDFSSQPLGLMAQEGSEIEKRVNNEWNNSSFNSNANNNTQVQSNPFAENFAQPNVNQVPNDNNLSTGQVQGNRFINTDFQMQITNPPQNTNIPQMINSSQMTNPPQVTNLNNQVSDNSIDMNQIPNSVSVSNKKKEEVNSSSQEAGSWGIFVFLFFVLVVAGAAFLFKSGKLDELLGDKESTETTSSETTNNEQQEEIKEAEETDKTEEVKNFQYKETVYVASGSTTTITSSGVVDLENRTGKYDINVNLAGVTSSNVTEYCDYVNNVCYGEVYKSNNEWLKESIYVKYLGPVEVYNYITSLGEVKDLGNGNYRISISGDLIKNLINDNDQITVSDFSNKTVTVDYLVENGYLKRVKYDVSSVVKNVDQCIIAQEFTNINSNDSITIPEDIVNIAK